MPAWLWRGLLGPVMRAYRQLVRPWVAVVVFSTVTVATHLPRFVTAAMRRLRGIGALHDQPWAGTIMEVVEGGPCSA